MEPQLLALHDSIRRVPSHADRAKEAAPAHETEAGPAGETGAAAGASLGVLNRAGAFVAPSSRDDGEPMEIRFLLDGASGGGGGGGWAWGGDGGVAGSGPGPVRTGAVTSAAELLEEVRDSFEQHYSPTSALRTSLAAGSFAPRGVKLELKQQMNLASHAVVTLLARATPGMQKAQLMPVLAVTVVEAKGLPKMDLGTIGTVDPYVVLTCCGSQRRTKVKKGSYRFVTN